jgi:glycosyltransferase involved in cell wall biosynthesis
MASVDVAVPNYQYGRYLRHCVTSVLQQGIDDIRVLIIDNASTDNSLEVANQLAREDSRVEVIAHGKNVGHLASFNEAIDWARADYFMILCADDLLVPGALSRAVSLMETHPNVNLTFGREHTLFSDMPAPAIDQPRDVHWRLLSGNFLLQTLCETGRPDASRFMIAVATAIVRTSAQKRVGYYRRHLPHTSDLEAWLRFGCIGDAAETTAIQAIRRVHPLNRSATVYNCHLWNLHWDAAFDSFFHNEGAKLPNAAHLRRTARRALAERAYWGCLSNLLRGDFRLSRELLGYAFSRCPATIVLPPFGYLFRQKDTLSRIANVWSQVARPPRRLPVVPLTNDH